MKNLVGLLFLLCFTESARAQGPVGEGGLKSFPREIVFCGSTGISLYNVAARFQNALGLPGRFSAGAVFGGSVETFLRPYMSIGLNYSQQDLTSTYQGGGYLQLVRANMGPKINFRLYNRPHFEFLLGVRAGYTWYTYSAANLVVGNGFGDLLKQQQELNLQFLSAMRIYITQSIGIVLESGVGVPFFLNGGICYRFRNAGDGPAPRKNSDLKQQFDYIQ
jgi:hypothetical protein